MGLFKKKIVKKTYEREHMKPVIRAKHLYRGRSSRIQRHTDRKNRRNHADQIAGGPRKIQRDI